MHISFDSEDYIALSQFYNLINSNENLNEIKSIRGYVQHMLWIDLCTLEITSNKDFVASKGLDKFTPIFKFIYDGNTYNSQALGSTKDDFLQLIRKKIFEEFRKLPYKIMDNKNKINEFEKLEELKEKYEDIVLEIKDMLINNNIIKAQ